MRTELNFTTTGKVVKNGVVQICNNSDHVRVCILNSDQSVDHDFRFTKEQLESMLLLMK